MRMPIIYTASDNSYIGQWLKKKDTVKVPLNILSKNNNIRGRTLNIQSNKVSINIVYDQEYKQYK